MRRKTVKELREQIKRIEIEILNRRIGRDNPMRADKWWNMIDKIKEQILNYVGCYAWWCLGATFESKEIPQWWLVRQYQKRKEQ